MNEIEQSQQVKPLMISIENQSKIFAEFIGLEDNDRIIFSGIFGIGKTYFLKEFFKKSEKYIGIHLYPTNYTVSTNEDIFEYIKFDILYELLSKPIQLQKVEATKLEALAFLSTDDKYEIFLKFIDLIPEIGKKVTDVIKPLKEIADIISNKAKKVSVDEEEELKSFADRICSKQGSIYENDFYTELITKLIDQLKKDGKQLVIIVDDLDRIDPEHIFRILNIFAVHFDGSRIKEYTNKFNIDKIVVSCDINNIRKMFGARYGLDTDFNGYIDKFYSREVYHFDNRKYISDVVEEITGSIKYLSTTKPLVEAWLEDDTMREFINYLLKSMITSNTLNLRTLLRLLNRNVILQRKKLQFIEAIRYDPIYNTQLPITQVYDLLISLFEVPQSAINAIDATEFGKFDSKKINSLEIFQNIFAISHSENHNFNTGFGFPLKDGYTYSTDNLSNRFQIQVVREGEENRFGGKPITFHPSEIKKEFVLGFKIYVRVKNESII